MCIRDRTEAAGQLLDAGARLETLSVTGASPLVEAVRSARPNLVRMLLGRGANTDCVTRNGIGLRQSVAPIRHGHRCDKRLQRLQKNLCKRLYYFVNVYLNKNHMSETKQNYDSDEDN